MIMMKLSYTIVHTRELLLSRLCCPFCFASEQAIRAQLNRTKAIT